MAAPILRQSRSLFNSWTSLFAPSTGFSWLAIPSLAEVFPSIVLAVPKSKTSHSRKRMRAANKGLKDKQNIVNCPGCGHPKLAHHLCPTCYSQISRRRKEMNREAGLA